MAAFEMSKWYLDCITGAGDASIAYSGVVHWGAIRLHYSSLLESTGGLVGVKHSLRPQDEPTIDGGSLRWRSRALQTDGEWQADSAEIRETVFASETGAVEWHCLMPRALARIHDRTGIGYAEHLRMTIAPWKLPIRTLRWGRFGTPSEWIVWIDWLGEVTRHIVYRNGQPASTRLIEDGQIEFHDGARLCLDRSLVLRQGPLGSTALSVIPGIREIFPARMLQVTETKWRSQGRLGRPGGSTVHGWAVHERVDWPQ